jgi:hypothetical protein
VRAADLPLLPCAIGGQDERALARACKYPYTAHFLLLSVPPGATKRLARPGTITPDPATAARHSYHDPLTS